MRQDVHSVFRSRGVLLCLEAQRPVAPDGEDGDHMVVSSGSHRGVQPEVARAMATAATPDA
jgi:hypothetical protein